MYVKYSLGECESYESMFGRKVFVGGIVYKFSCNRKQGQGLEGIDFETTNQT